MNPDDLCEASARFETLTLGELFSRWSDLLWLNGMRPMVQSMLQLDLTMSENIVLRQLQHQSLTIAEVAAYLSITHSAASRAVDRLVHDGFICRVENPADRRQKVLTLTDRGSAFIQDLQSKFTAGIEFLAASLSPEEQEQFRLLIAHMVAAQCPGGKAPSLPPGRESESSETAHSAMQ
jgi:DNA-binding MarR family transcriptional regulator